MIGISDRLDPTSEMLALSTTGDTKNILICLIETLGADGYAINVGGGKESGPKVSTVNPTDQGSTIQGIALSSLGFGPDDGSPNVFS